jgi:hypothetical protein
MDETQRPEERASKRDEGLYQDLKALFQRWADPSYDGKLKEREKTDPEYAAKVRAIRERSKGRQGDSIIMPIRRRRSRDGKS